MNTNGNLGNTPSSPAAASPAAGAARDDAKQTALSTTVGTVLDEAKQTLGHVVTARADAEKGKVVHTMDDVANALRGASTKLREPGPLPKLAERAADRVNDAARYVQSRSIRQLAGEVETYARREPWIFLGSALALGIVGGRFLKSSTSAEVQAQGDGQSPSESRAR